MWILRCVIKCVNESLCEVLSCSVNQSKPNVLSNSYSSREGFLIAFGLQHFLAIANNSDCLMHTRLSVNNLVVTQEGMH